MWTRQSIMKIIILQYITDHEQHYRYAQTLIKSWSDTLNFIKIIELRRVLGPQNRVKSRKPDFTHLKITVKQNLSQRTFVTTLLFKRFFDSSNGQKRILITANTGSPIDTKTYWPMLSYTHETNLDYYYMP